MNCPTCQSLHGDWVHMGFSMDCHTWPEVLILLSELFNGYVKNEILSRRKESYLPCCEILNNSVWLIFQDRCVVKCGETVRFAIYCIVYKQINILRKCGETVRFAMMSIYLQTNFFLVLFYTNLSYLAVSNFSSLWELTEGGPVCSASHQNLTKFWLALPIDAWGLVFVKLECDHQPRADFLWFSQQTNRFAGILGEINFLVSPLPLISSPSS